MARKARNRPTDAELAILSVLWEQGPSTVRKVHRALEQRSPTGYTTVLKTMQIMTDKRLLVRDESTRAHVYRPAVGRDETELRLVDDLVERAFGGSASRLVLRALSARRASPETIAEIRRLLDEATGDET